MRDTYCKIFVDTKLESDQLVSLLAGIGGGSIDSRTVTCADYELDVMRNEEFDAAKSEGSDGFLFYRYYLDILSTTESAREPYIQNVARLLEGLWRSGCRAVAACNFESELPRCGGIRNPDPV
jgi:hypothetical protein